MENIWSLKSWKLLYLGYHNILMVNIKADPWLQDVLFPSSQTQFCLNSWVGRGINHSGIFTHNKLTFLIVKKETKDRYGSRDYFPSLLISKKCLYSFDTFHSWVKNNFCITESKHNRWVDHPWYFGLFLKSYWEPLGNPFIFGQFYRIQ